MEDSPPAWALADQAWVIAALQAYLHQRGPLMQERDDAASQQAIVRLLEKQSVVLPVYRAWTAFGQESAPGFAERLAQSAAEVKACCLALDSELRRVCERFAAEQLDVAVIKGAALTAKLYGIARCRQYRDIDLLVPLEQQPQAAASLFDLGYSPAAARTPRQLKSDLHTQHARSFRHAHLNIEVDLHWQLIEKQFAIQTDPSGVWSRINRSALNSIIDSSAPPAALTVGTLSNSDTVLFLSAHASKDLWQEYRALLDLSLSFRILSAEDQKVLLQLAQELRQERLLAVSVHMAAEVLNAEVPKALGDFANSVPGSRKLADELSDALLSGAKLNEAAGARLQLALRSGWREKLRYCFGRLTIPHDEDWESNIPDWLFPLHYAAKPLKTARRALFGPPTQN